MTPSARPVDPSVPALDEIVAQAVTEWDRLQGPSPDLLYHYTDVAGLIGILSSGSLWATNLRFMNDARELEHARRLMLDVLTEARSRAARPGQHALIDAIEVNLSTWSGYPDYYSVSFSSDGDLLSQWRGYGLAGGGYAIGFDPDGLACPGSSYPQPNRFLNRVVYERDRQAQILRSVADAMLTLFADVDANDAKQTEARARVFSALGEVAGYVFSFKDPAWAEEKEWRAVYLVPAGETKNVRFRPQAGVAVPFIPLGMENDPGGKLPIRRIVQGPAGDPDMAARSLELLLLANGYTEVDTTRSAVPLRT
jgi:hypothetical protein